MESSSEEETLIFYALYRCRIRSLRKQGRFWTRPIYSQRKQLGCYSTLVQKMRLNDPEMYLRYFRMSKERFDDLLHKICTTHLAIYSSILSTLLWLTGMTHAQRQHYSSSVRPEICPAEMLSVGLRYLATGNSQVSKLIY